MSNATQHGRAARLRKPDLFYYDQLPPIARQALANAAFSWSAGHIHNAIKRGKLDPDITGLIANADARQIAKDRTRVWGES